MIKEDLKYVHSSYFKTDFSEQVVDVVFLCELASGEPYPKSPDEVDLVRWMTTSEIMTDVNSPNYLKESIKRAESLMKRK